MELIKAELLRDRRGVTLTFSDGLAAALLASVLQKHCPCIICQNKEASAATEIYQVDSIGNYALQFTFNAGCSKGYYSHELLRELCLE